MYAAAKSRQLCPTLWSHRRQPTRLRRPWDSPGKNTGVGCPFPSPVHESEKWKWSCSVVSDSSRPQGLQHASLPCPSPTPGAYSNLCPSSRWYHLTTSSSVGPFSSHVHPFPASGSFPMSQFFASGSKSIAVSASVLPMNIQEWFPLGWTGWISLQSKGLSRVFSNTTVQKHRFFSTQLSL